MKRVLMAAAAASLFVAPAFAADSASTAIDFSGTVENTCVLEAGADSAATNASLAGTTVTLSDLVDDTTAVLNASGLTLTFADSYCNYAHDVDLDATNGGLISSAVSGDVVGGTFVTRIGYTADLSWAGQAINLAPTTDTNDFDGAEAVDGTKIDIAGANREDLTIVFAIAQDNPNDPVLAGTYSETLTIEMGPSL